MHLKKNTLKQKLNQGKTTIGPFVGLPSPGIVETMGWMGFDFVVIDCEHGPMDYETAEHMIRAAELSNTTAILRIGLNEQQNIQRYMDAGAAGVMIPLSTTDRMVKRLLMQSSIHQWVSGGHLLVEMPISVFKAWPNT